MISGRGETISGGIRALIGMDMRIESGEPSAISARGRHSCDAKCNVEGTEPQCTGNVYGHSLDIVMRMKHVGKPNVTQLRRLHGAVTHVTAVLQLYKQISCIKRSYKVSNIY